MEEKEKNKIVKIEIDTSDFPKEKLLTKYADDVELSKRVATVVEMFSQGYQRRDIVEYGTKKWGVTIRMVDHYISWAKEDIIQSIQLLQLDSVELHSARLLDLRQKAVEEKDYRLALDIEKEFAKLQGLYKPTEKKVSVESKAITINYIKPLPDGN